MIWYLRSLADGDTHYGDWQPDGTVIARCGVRFELPVQNYPGLSGEPAYPEQVCLRCRRPPLIVKGNP